MIHKSNGIDANSLDQWTCKCGFKTWNFLLWEKHMMIGAALQTDEGKAKLKAFMTYYADIKKYFIDTMNLD